MKAVIQRVKRAAVRVDNEIVGEIDKGLCLLVGVTVEDVEAYGDYLAEKGYERQAKPREVNGGRDRLPRNYAQKNKDRLNSSLATTPAQAKSTTSASTVAKKKRAQIKTEVPVVKAESPATPFPFFTIICLIAITVISLYVIHLYIELDDMNATITEYNNRIVEMKNE